MSRKLYEHNVPDETEIEAAVAAGNSAAVFALFERQKKSFEQELRKREREYRTLAENSPEGILRLDRDFQIIYANPAAVEMMGSAREELLGKTPLEFPMPMHLAAMWQSGVKRVFASGQIESFEYDFDDLHLVHYLRISMIPEFGPDGAIESVLAITRDISEQKKTIVALRESEERFRLALMTAPITVYIQDGSLRYTWLYSSNPEIPAETFLGHTDSDIYPAEEAARMNALKQGVLQSGQSAQVETEITIPEGKVWLDVTVAPLRNNEGQVIGITGVALDISDRKQVEKTLGDTLGQLKSLSDQLREVNEALVLSNVSLQESEERYRAIFENAGVGIAIGDKEGHSVQSNRVFQKMLGYTEEELRKLTFRDYTLDVDLPEENAYVNEILSGTRDCYSIEKRYLQKNGRVIWVRLIATVLRDREKNPAFGVAMVYDITVRKRIEETLRKSEERYRLIVETAEEGILILDMEGNLTFVNRKAVILFDYSEKEMLGKNIRDFAAPGDRDALRTIMERRKSGVRELFEFRYMRKDGSELLASVGANPIIDQQGKFLGSLFMITDVTERHRLEENVQRLRRDQESFLRHEVKNLFAPIQLFAELTLDSDNLTDEQSHYLERIVDTAKRAAGFIDSLKSIQDIETGKYALNRVRRPLEAVIRQAIQNLQPLAEKSGVTVQFHEPEKTMLLPLDPQLLPGVFANLIRNAIEHVAGLSDPAEKLVTVDLQKERGRYIVRITNRGVLISPERLDIFFEKFNSGPEKKGGTGLGTTYAWSVVRAHGGEITVTSDAGQGTTLTLVFPVP